MGTEKWCANVCLATERMRMEHFEVWAQNSLGLWENFHQFRLQWTHANFAHSLFGSEAREEITKWREKGRDKIPCTKDSGDYQRRYETVKRSTAWPWTWWMREQSSGDGEVRDGESSFPSSYDAAGWVKRSCKGGVQSPGREWVISESPEPGKIHTCLILLKWAFALSLTWDGIFLTGHTVLLDYHSLVLKTTAVLPKANTCCRTLDMVPNDRQCWGSYLNG